MGDTVATTENGYECIARIAVHAIKMVNLLDTLIDGLRDEAAVSILTALCSDITGVGLRLRVFAIQYQEELECISIDQ